MKRAALRDASFYDSPGYAGRYHVAYGEGWTPACNPYGALLTETTGRDAATVPEHVRCQRPGCRKRWPKPTW